MASESDVIERQDSVADRRGLVLLACLTALLGFFLIQPGIGLDGISYFGYLRSAVQDGDLDLRNEFTFLGVSRQDFNMTPEGHVRNVFPIGSAVLWTPFYVSGMGAAPLAERLAGEPPAEGYSRLHVFFVYVATACLGLAALVVCWRFASRVAPRGASLHATIAFWLASPFVYYQFVKGDYSHIPSALCVALFLIAWAVPRPGIGHYLTLGLLGGLAAMVRWQDALVLFLPVLELAWALFRSAGLRPRNLRVGALDVRWDPEGIAEIWTGRRLLGAAGALVGGAVLGALPQLVYWRVTLGEWLTVPQGPGFLVWSRPEIVKTLFSSFHGLFGWHPLLLVSVAGLFLLLRTHRRLVVGFLLLFAAETYINSIVWDWEAGVSFGGRRFLSLTLLFIVGLARVYAALPRFVSVPVTLAAVLGNALLLHEFHLGLISRRWFVSFEEIWSRHLELLPRLPSVLATWVSNHQGRQWAEALPVVLLPALGWLLVTTLLLAAFTRRRRALAGVLLVVLCLSDAVFVRAAVVSRPSPIAYTMQGRTALIDYRWYENAHYHMDPFRPDYPGWRHFMGLGGKRLEHGGIPFEIPDPMARPLENGSALTTCHLRDARLRLALAPQRARAVWLALDGGVLLKHGGEPAGSVEIVYEDGARTDSTLVAGRDVWDYWDTPPPERILWQGQAPAELVWFRLPADTARVPSALVLRSPARAEPPGPGVTLFAVTLEPVTGEPVIVPLGAAANTDFMQDPFRPGYARNHFPHLGPGDVTWQGTPFRILDVEPGTGRGTLITTAYQPAMRLKIPLLPRASERVDLVLDGAGIRGLPDLVLGDILVHYDRGAPTRTPVIAGRDVWDYWETPPPDRILWRGSPEETLSGLRIPLDPDRRPRCLELVSARARGNNGIVAGYAVFALSQTLAEEP